MRAAFILLCAFAMSAAFADEIAIPGYEGVKLLKVEPDGLKILHDKGISKVPFESLSDELKKKYKLEEHKAEEYRKFIESENEDQKFRAEREEKLNKLKSRIRGSILQVLPDGVLMQRVEMYQGRKEEKDLVRTGNQPVGMGRNSMNPKADYVAEVVTQYRWVDSWQDYADLIFISCPTEGLGESRYIELDVWRIGNYTYLNKFQQERTVELFTSKKEKAEEILN